MIFALQIIGGLLMLVAGGEALVRGSVSIANRIGVPVIIIGLTIVAMGTSAPEMVISVLSTMDGHPDIAIGNIIGSNIANILLVLGITSLIYPITTNPEVTKRDGLLMVVLSFLFLLFIFNGEVARYEGAILIAFIVGYLLSMFYRAQKKGDPEIIEEFEEEASFKYPFWMAVPMLIAGLALLVFGAEIMIDGASDVARLLGVSEGVIGATIVAIGTSAPELVTCVVAAYRCHPDIAVGNIIGSNIFNIAAVGGVAALVVPMDVHQQFIQVDIWIMLVSSTLLIPLMLSDKKISRVEGSVMFLWYLLYIGYQYTLTTPEVGM